MHTSQLHLSDVFHGGIGLGVPPISILNPGIRIFLENLQKPGENGDRFSKRTMVEKNGETTLELGPKIGASCALSLLR